MDFVKNGVIDFSNLKFLLLGEAGRMLKMGLGSDIEFIAFHPTMPPKVRAVFRII